MDRLDKLMYDMDYLDKIIDNTEYLVKVLNAYKRIIESGSCNNCAIKKYCQVAPKWGQPVRYNCPLYQKEEEE